MITHDTKTKLIDELLKDYSGSAEEILGSNGLFDELKKRLLERAMQGELTTELGYEKSSRIGTNSGNSRNGTTSKTIKTENGEIELSIPRDRKGDYDPIIIPKHQRRIEGFNEMVLSLYSRGLSTRDIQEHLVQIYKTEVSAALISNVTKEVEDDVKQWQSRPLDSCYPIVFFDALFVKVKQDGEIKNHAIYTALAINQDGRKEVLGLWNSKNEGSKFWLSVMTELKNRGVNDLLICCVDGLKGFPEAIENVFPQAKVQLCIVHMVRNSLKYVSYKDYKAVCSDLKGIYRSPTEEIALDRLNDFSKKWDSKYPTISKSWEAKWVHLSVFFQYPQEIRTVIYTTNAVESLHSSLRKISRNRKLFQNPESVLRLFYLAIVNASKKWSHPIRNWNQAIHRFMIESPEAFKQ